MKAKDTAILADVLNQKLARFVEAQPSE